MENLTSEEKDQSVEAFKSIIRKSEKALSHMNADAPPARLLEKRMKAARIGVNTLLKHWEGQEMDVSKTDLNEAKEELEGLLLTLPSFLKRLKEGSGQRTYITRRIKALKVALFYMEDWIEKKEAALKVIRRPKDTIAAGCRHTVGLKSDGTATAAGDK